ncbi:hypothetical protein BH09PSE4_BH09PSE4_08040 [soil metagenome]
MKLPDRLPHLGGMRGTIVAGIFWACAALTLVHVIGSSWYNGRDMFVNVPSSMPYGFKTYTSHSAPVVGEVIGSGARAAGLIRGSRFVSIDGEAMPANATEFTVGDRLHSDGDGRITLVLKDPSGNLRTYVLRRDPNTWTLIEPRSNLPVWAYSSFTLATMQLPLLILIGVASMLAARRPRDPAAMLIAIGMLLFCFTPGPGFWLVANYGVPDAAFQVATQTAFLITILAVTGFPDGRFPTAFARWTAITIAVAIVAFNVLHLSGLVIGGTIFPLVAMALTVMWRRYRSNAGQPEGQQIKWAVFGFGAGTIILVSGTVAELTGILGPGHGTLAYMIDFLCFSVGQILGPLGLLVSLMRYRLYDAEAAISRSAAYAVLTVSLVAIFAGSEKIIEVLGEEYFGGQLGAVASGLGAALAAATIAPLHHRIGRWAEKRFQPALIRLRKGLPLLVGDLRETASLPEIAGATLAQIEAGVRAENSAILVDGQAIGTRGERGDYAVRVPLTADGIGDVGELLLGPRPDGSLYGKDEREALAEIADPVARAIAIVRRRESERHATDARFARLEAMVAKFASPVAAD